MKAVVNQLKYIIMVCILEIIVQYINKFNQIVQKKFHLKVFIG